MSDVTTRIQPVRRGLRPAAEARGELEPAAAPAEPPHLQAVGLHKSYRKGQHTIPVLRGVDLTLARGELLAIVGQSGSGKSTLLHLLGTLDAADSGEVRYLGQRIDNLPVARRDRFRNRQLGMIFQFYHLLPELTALENVLAPLMIAHSAWEYFRQRKAARERAAHLLELVGLSHRMEHRPKEMSGGEMQRAAIARALIAGPDVLLADEPTGNLDRQTGEGVLEVLHALNREQGLSMILVTHDQHVAQQADRIVRLAEGRVAA